MSSVTIRIGELCLKGVFKSAYGQYDQFSGSSCAPLAHTRLSFLVYFFQLISRCRTKQLKGEVHSKATKMMLDKEKNILRQPDVKILT